MMLALTSAWGRDRAVTEFRPNKLISIGNSGDELSAPRDIPKSRHLRLEFDDIIEPRVNLTVPDHRHVERLLEFGAAWNTNERLLIHCNAGQSRSPATAIVLLAQKNPARENDVVGMVRDRAHHIMPNRLLIALGDCALGCNGRLIEAVARMREPTLRDFQNRWVEFPAFLDSR